MASSSRDKNGNAIVQVVCADGRRRSIRLGKLSDARVEIIRQRVELLRVAQQHGHALDGDVVAWLAKMDDSLHAKLAAVGLVQSRRSATLGRFIDEYIATRTDIRGNSIINMRQAGRRLKVFLGADKPMREVVSRDADLFAVYLRTTLSEATAARTIKYAKQFWRSALRGRIVAEDPFIDIKPGAMDNSERQAFISAEDTAKVMAACPDQEWRLIVALCRFGGLRCPSELNVLTWSDVNWETNRIAVRSPKTGMRLIPLFPELREPLSECFEAAEDGAVFVIGDYVKQVNLRTRFYKIIERAGLVPWERLFHNLRASRQTELEDRFPSHVVCAWLGNSENVARKHYLQVRDEHFQRALQSAAKSGAVTRFTGCTDSGATDETPQNAGEMCLSETCATGGVLRNDIQYARRDSNPQPMVPKTIALSS
jgi:integrase